MIKAVFFDIGGVIVSDIEKYMMLDIAAEFGKDPRRLIEARGRYWAKYRTGEISEEEYWNGILGEAGIDGNLEDFKQRPYRYMTEMSGTLDIARKLKDKGYKLGIISNNSKEWGQYAVERYGLEELFDDIVLSCDDEVKSAKPAKKIYELALEKLGVRPEECVFIDDKKSNVTAANEVGMEAILFESSDQLSRDLKEIGIETLMDLKSL